MERRALFLRIMLWSLGFAAVSGVGAILLSGGDIAWRVVGTGVVTAAASALMIPLSMLVDSRRTRSAGLLGMAAVVSEFILGLLLIWEVIRLLFGPNVEERIGLTMVFLGVTAPPALGSVLLAFTDKAGKAARLAIGLCVAVLTLLLIGVWLPGRWPGFDDRWWQTAGILAGYGFIAVLCLVDVGRKVWWPLCGVAGAALAAALVTHDIWVGRGSDLGFVLFVGLSCFGGAAAHANLARLCPLKPGQHWLRALTVLAVVLIAVLAVVLAIEDRFAAVSRDAEDLLWRVLGAAAILGGCGTLSLVVLAGLNRRVEYRPISVEAVMLTVACPRCGRSQRLHIGNDCCRTCGLRIHIRIEEPRCPQCDYLLYAPASDRCPECGTLFGQGFEVYGPPG